MNDPNFFKDVVKPKLEEIAKLCEEQGCEFQAIVAYETLASESIYFGDFKFMVLAKLECLRPDRQKILPCQQSR